MNLEEIKAQLQNQIKVIWDRVQESTPYIRITDRYNNLSPSLQKVVMIIGGMFVTFVILYIPWSNLDEANDAVHQYETKRNLIRELMKATREANDIPDLPKAPPMLKEQIKDILKSLSIYDEQIRSIEDNMVTSKLFPTHLTQGAVQVYLTKLTIRQVMNISFQLQRLSPSVKLKDLDVFASQDEVKYLDAKFQLVSLKVPDVIVPPPLEDNKKKKNSPNKGSASPEKKPGAEDSGSESDE